MNKNRTARFIATLIGGFVFSFALAQSAPSSTSRCESFYPPEQEQTIADMQTTVSLRVTNPDGPEVNVSAVFDIPPQITPVNLSEFKTWDPAQRKLTLALGDFQSNEEKQALLDFQGKPNACIIYGTLQGQWNPAPATGPNSWQDQINFSLILSAAPVGAPSFLDQFRTGFINENAPKAAVAAGAIGVAATAAGLPWWNLLNLLHFASVGSLRKKPEHPWGVVLDGATKKPVAEATVKVYDAATNKIKETGVTDVDGRFGFLVPAGLYYLHVNGKGFEEYDSQFVTVSENKEEALNLEIPLKPRSYKSLFFKRFLGWLSDIFYVGSPWLLVLGTIVSLVVAILVPATLHYAVLGLYVVMDAIKILIDHLTGRSSGKVVDKDSGAPLDLAVVRIFEARHNYLLLTHVTNPKGHFKFLVTPGEYFVTCSKDGYQPYTSQPLTVRRSDIIRLDVPMAVEKAV